MHLIEQLKRPLIIAHRGASAHAPENTVAAFKLAVEHGADGVELDVKLSADGQMVVIHDQTVDRTTASNGVNGKNAVRDLTLEQLKSLDAGGCFDARFAGETIPTLDEVFSAVGQETLINVEITNYVSPGDALPDRVADLVIRRGLQERVFFSSFHPLNLIRVRRRLPDTPVAILTQVGEQGRLLRGWLGRWVSPEVVHPYYLDVTDDYLDAEHRRGRRVNTWTVNDPNEIKRLFKIGIDGIITDDPRLARQVLEE
jgi:glycerophosphoryl diester phosphodiesterase